MLTIEQIALSNGAHRTQINAKTIPEGWLPIHPSLDEQEVISYLPFINIDEIENGYITKVSQGTIPEPDIELIRESKLQEISNQCNQVILSGVDVETSQGTNHFNLSLEDQSNIGNLFNLVILGGTEYPYQSDGGVCTIYSAEDIIKIYVASQTHITYNTTYHNLLKSYVQSLETVDEINSVNYGDELIEPYATDLQEKLSIAQQQMQNIIAKIQNNA